VEETGLGSFPMTHFLWAVLDLRVTSPQC